VGERGERRGERDSREREAEGVGDGTERRERKVSLCQTASF